MTIIIKTLTEANHLKEILENNNYVVKIKKFDKKLYLIDFYLGEKANVKG